MGRIIMGRITRFSNMVFMRTHGILAVFTLSAFLAAPACAQMGTSITTKSTRGATACVSNIWPLSNGPPQRAINASYTCSFLQPNMETP